MERLPYGFWTGISSDTGISVQELSDYASTRKRPGRERAMVLERATGIDAKVWLYGTAQEINGALHQTRAKAC